MCKYYNQGKCTKEANCNFAHTSLEVQQSPVLYRTRLCISRYKGGRCKNGGKCTYAHSRQELRSNLPINGQPEEAVLEASPTTSKCLSTRFVGIQSGQPEEPVLEASPTASKRLSTRSVGTQAMPSPTSPRLPTPDLLFNIIPGYVNDNNTSPVYNNSGHVHMDGVMPQVVAKAEKPFHPTFPEWVFQAPTAASLQEGWSMSDSMTQSTNKSIAPFSAYFGVIVKNTFLTTAANICGNASRRKSKSMPR